MKTVVRAADEVMQVFCPACQRIHAFNTGEDSPRWTFNRDMEKPTFTPSMLVFANKCDDTGAVVGQITICHSFVTDGRIQFLDDCPHALRGQTVDLPEFS